MTVEPKKQRVVITAPCMAARKSARVGEVLELDIREANQLVGMQRAKLVSESDAKSTGRKAEKQSD
ncbi:hypothetical protein Mag101_07425 [Microbulbifer agarilyticus]|uniref:AbrB family transcriptional regulator n=1 Tax=Microbulbifer agarilyticus TaxID=260552 RepID=A0A1Q2M4L8_9GAMM|nr:hypothetical protein Mag101_07425 [Microbulbifer agarilyticus]